MPDSRSSEPTNTTPGGNVFIPRRPVHIHQRHFGLLRHLRQLRGAGGVHRVDDDRVHAGGNEALHLIGLASGVAAGVFKLYVDVAGLSFFLNGLADNSEKVLIEVGH